MPSFRQLSLTAFLCDPDLQGKSVMEVKVSYTEVRKSEDSESKAEAWRRGMKIQDPLDQGNDLC